MSYQHQVEGLVALSILHTGSLLATTTGNDPASSTLTGWRFPTLSYMAFSLVEAFGIEPNPVTCKASSATHRCPRVFLQLAGRVGLEPTYISLTGRPPTGGAPANNLIGAAKWIRTITALDFNQALYLLELSLHTWYWWSTEGIEPHARGTWVTARLWTIHTY